MSIPPNFLSSLTCQHPKVVMERFLDKSPKSKGVAVWVWRSEVAPVDLYCYLGARFGPPNGPQNFFRNDDSDNLIHWEWVLDFPGGMVHILGMTFRTELWLVGDLQLNEADSAALATAIKADFAVHGPRMSTIRKSLERWIEFANPYHRLRRAVEKLLADLKGLGLQPETEELPDITDPANAQIPQREELLARYSKGLGLCFGVRSMLPVMAEAYVNFLLFALMRPELKADDRLRENVLRQPIDVRIKSLHINCSGFAKAIDYASVECKAYHRLVNERNDLLHGNVVLEKLRFSEVFFNGKVPVFKEYRSMWERSVGVDIKAVGLRELFDEVATVNAVIAYLGTCMVPEIKAQIDLMAEKRDLGWNQDTGRIGIFFPDHLVDMLVVHGTSSSSLTGDA